MARAATTSDAFNAIAEPQRRRILVLLKDDEVPAGEVASQLGLNQSATSKHLRVLREVGLVHVHREGKRRVYGLDAGGLRPIHEWTGGFEEFWSETFGRLDEYVRGLQREEKSSAN
ncbi:MAG TPA: metalloregulator ArsR/SmtB family transcription factor [Acidimicrobiia bacterium]|jgi:DNA-binding transcriptional ArsR family regulator|nr:metalloregulator ArsR/SmtB family transcription factor [Acidimicrobiia bacterium]